MTKHMPFFISLSILPLALGACSSGASRSEASAAAPAAAQPVAMAGRATFEGLSFTLPASWKVETPSSSMRLAQYRVSSGGESEDGECAVFHFPGTGGSVRANLDRWYGQFQQPGGGNTADLAKVEKFEAGGFLVTQVDVSGTYTGSTGPMGGGGEPMPGYRMVAGVVETPQGPWFLKCTGPEQVMASAVPEVRALLETVGP